MSVIGHDRYRLFVVSGYHPANDCIPLCLKPNAFADLKAQHLDVSTHLPDHAKPLSNFLVEVYQF